jgi:hypothetical protein
MITSYGIIQRFKKIAAIEKLKLHKVKISFAAPPKTSAETYDIKKKKEFESNFQWSKYSLIVSNSNKTEWYIYIVDLEPWGIKIKGTEKIYDSDDKGHLYNFANINYKDIEKQFSRLLDPINLDPDLPESMVTYINGHIKDKAKEYTPSTFLENFENVKTEKGTNFYILVTKTNELKTPFGKLVGKVPAIK